jgi:hypothetical protein
MVNTLSRYLAKRFLITLAAVFGSIFALIFIIDFVEMMRKTADLPRSTTLQLAQISLMRAPSIAEKVLPFVVLVGGMITLINLTRRLELVVARSVGMSVWQFLAPLAIPALIVGVLATVAYNPVAAQLKSRADRLETKLGARALRAGVDEGIWLRQRSVDGQSVLRGEISSDGGTSLSGVSAYVYDQDGRFIERVDAQRGVLIGRTLAVDQRPGCACRRAGARCRPVQSGDQPHARASHAEFRSARYGALLEASAPGCAQRSRRHRRDEISASFSRAYLSSTAFDGYGFHSCVLFIKILQVWWYLAHGFRWRDFGLRALCGDEIGI